jgi:hypothetical protein
MENLGFLRSLVLSGVEASVFGLPAIRIILRVCPFFNKPKIHSFYV